MDKDKVEKKSHTQLIAGDIRALEKQLAAANLDLEKAKRDREKIVSQQDELVDIARNDTQAAAKLNKLEEDEIRLSQAERRYSKEVTKLRARIGKLTEGLDFAEKLEAVERVVDERGPRIQAKMERLDVLFEEAATIIDDELIPLGRQNIDDVNLVHPQHADTRRYNPVWHLVDALNWRFHALYPRNALPDPSLRKPLGELWRESLKAAKFALMQNLKTNSDEREVA